MDGTTEKTHVRFRTDWSNEDRFFPVAGAERSWTEFTLKLFSTPHFANDHNSTLEFYFDPDCSYEVLLRFDLKTALSQVLLYHGEGVLSYCFAFVLVVIARQLADLGRLGLCFDFGDSLSRSSTFLALTVIPALFEALSFLPSVPPPLAPYLGRVKSVEVSNTESLIIRVLLWSLAFGVISLVAKFIEVLLRSIAEIYIKLKKKMRTSWEDPSSVPQYNENHTSRTLTASLVAVLAVSVGVGGGIGLVGVVIVHFVQVSLSYD